MSNVSKTVPASIQLQIAIDAQGDIPKTNVSGTNPFLANLNVNVSGLGGTSNGSFNGATAGAATSAGAFSLPGIDTASWEKGYSQIAQIGAALDSMQDEAMKLMSSRNPSDQAKGNQMMQQFQQIMSAIIKAIQIAGDMAKTAINASQSH